jgi:acetate kinase
MSDAIIVLNAGSSSLKFSIYGVTDHELNLAARGQIEGLGTSPRFKAKDQQGHLLADASLDGFAQGFGHPEAFAYLAEWALAQYGGRLKAIAVGHRMAHGGLEFTGPTLIDADVVARLEQLVPLVPLHQPHNLAAIRGVMRLRPDLTQVACFDTAFHRTKPKVADRFGLPDEMFQRGARRWGFHGLSYESIAGKLRQIAPDVSAGRVIVAHLGSGASLCAMKDGKSVDTTMGFSALDGLPMGTRCGNLDPGAILFLLRQGWSVDRIEDLLYKKSGLLGISNVSNDVRVLLASDCPLAAEAIEYFVYRIVREIGSLTAALGGLDALVFTAGIGENSPVIRQRVCEGLSWLGITIEPDANQRGGTCISPPRQAPAVWVVPTDEEGVIASHTLAVVRSVRTQQVSRVSVGGTD